MKTTAYEIRDIQFKDAGLFAARVAAFGNEDLNGDRMVEGAFARTIANLRDEGKKLPVIWSHEHNDHQRAYVGEVDPTDLRETPEGLVVAGKFFIDDEDPERRSAARSIFDLMKRGLISAWSFAFTTPQGGERIGKDGVRELTDVDLIEVGPTLVGANPEAQTIALKALGWTDDAIETKRGRRISAATEDKLRKMEALLRELLGGETEVEEESRVLSEVDRHRLALADLDDYLSERGR